MVDKAEPPGPVLLEQMHMQRAQRHDGRGRPPLPHDRAVPLQSLCRTRWVADGKAPNIETGPYAGAAVDCRTLLRVLKIDVVRGADEEVLKLELERLERGLVKVPRGGVFLAPRGENLRPPRKHNSPAVAAKGPFDPFEVGVARHEAELLRAHRRKRLQQDVVRVKC